MEPGRKRYDDLQVMKERGKKRNEEGGGREKKGWSKICMGRTGRGQRTEGNMRDY